MGYLPTVHPNLLCSLWENGRRGLDSCHPMWPVIALKVHTVVRDEKKQKKNGAVVCCGCPGRDPMVYITGTWLRAEMELVS